jgi:hypothetical protein
MLFLFGLAFADAINTVAHETSDGILKLTYDKSLTASYESYKTGVYYEHIYTEGGIMEIHPLFTLDPSLIKDCIEENKPVLHIDEVVTITYEIEYARRNYVIILEIEQKIEEDVDIVILNLQRQNKALLKKIVSLEKKIDNDLHMMEKNINSLIDTYDFTKWGILTYDDINRDIKGMGNDFIHVVRVLLALGDRRSLENYANEHGGTTSCNEKHGCILHRYLKYPYSDIYRERIKNIIKLGANVNEKDREGNTPLGICNKILTGMKGVSESFYTHDIEDIIKYLKEHGAKE